MLFYDIFMRDSTGPASGIVPPVCDPATEREKPMSQKPDYYAVLGVDKTAPLEEIKRAYSKAVMKYHPDRMLKKSAEEKAEAQVKFQGIEDAYKVLSDTNKRNTYDSYGHEGLDRLASGQSAGTGSSFVDLAGPGVKRRAASEDELFDFFRPKTTPETPAVGTPEAPVSASDAAAARRARRESRHGAPTPGVAESITSGVTISRPPADPVGKPSAPAAKPARQEPAPKTAGGFDFAGVTKDVRATQDGLAQVNRAGMAEVPLDTLERFRDNLQDMLKVVDEAIARTRRNDGPRR